MAQLMYVLCWGALVGWLWLYVQGSRAGDWEPNTSGRGRTSKPDLRPEL